jgi:hypothetical protein
LAKWATGNHPWKGSLKTISWHGFEHGEGLIGFRATKQQSSSMMRLCQAELMILIWGSKGGEIRQNDKLVQNPSQNRNPDIEPSQKDSMMDTRLQVGLKAS